MTRSTAAGLLLLITFILGVTGIVLFVRRDITGSFALFDLERSLILASWLVGAGGVVLLATVRLTAVASTLLVGGAMVFAVGAVIAAIYEVSEIASGFIVSNGWVVVFVSLLLIGGTLIGAGLLRSGLVPTWVAWTVVMWNALWLVGLLLNSQEDMYYPGLHYFPLLLIGIPLARHRMHELEP